MQRRALIALLGGAASWPLAAGAQQKAIPVVGYLGIGTPGSRVSILNAFREGLNETGYVEGRNVAIEYRWAEGDTERHCHINEPSLPASSLSPDFGAGQ